MGYWYIPILAILAHLQAEMTKAALGFLGLAWLYTHLWEAQIQSNLGPNIFLWSMEKSMKNPLHQWGAAILLWSLFGLLLSWSGKGSIMVPWDSIMVITPLGWSYRVKAGPASFCMVWKGVWNTPAGMRCRHIPTVVILAHVWAEIANTALWCLVVALWLTHLWEAQIESKLGLGILIYTMKQRMKYSCSIGV